MAPCLPGRRAGWHVAQVGAQLLVSQAVPWEMPGGSKAVTDVMTWTVDCRERRTLKTRGDFSLLPPTNTAEGHWDAEGCSCVRCSEWLWGLTLFPTVMDAYTAGKIILWVLGGCPWDEYLAQQTGEIVLNFVGSIIGPNGTKR